jgi:hypothetical protein
VLPCRSWRRRWDQQQQEHCSVDDGSISEINIVFALEFPRSFFLDSARSLDQESRMGPESEER